jgi:hypothetical protein
MCWNAEVSFQSFLVGILAIGLGAYRNAPIPVLLFSLSIVLMQFIEYIVWSNYDNKDINRQASFAAAGLLWLQPIASILTLPASSTRTTALGAYTGLSLLSTLIGGDKDYSMTRAPNGHLAWNWLEKDWKTAISLGVYFVFLLAPLLMSKKFVLLGLALGTLLISLFTYWKDNTWGSMWCWIVNIIAVLSIARV